MRVGTPTFVADRLAEARRARGLTQTAVADMLGLSRNAVSAYENGRTTPSPPVLVRIAAILSVRPDRLTMPLAESASPPIFYRSFASATKRARDRAEARGTWLRELVSHLETYLKFPTPAVPRIDAPILDDAHETTELAWKLAASVRRNFGMADGPISDVILLLENAGVIVARTELESPSLHAYSFVRADGRPFVVLGAERSSGARDRLNAAHELAHLVAHRSLDSAELSRRTRSESSSIEQFAWAFGGAFLMPPAVFAPEFSRAFRYRNLSDLRPLRSRWGVSIQAMLAHAKRLDLLDEEGFRIAQIEISRRHWRKREPGEDEVPIESVRLLRRAFLALREAKLLRTADVETAIGLERGDIERVCGFEPGFLDDDIPTLQFHAFRRPAGQPR